MPEENVIDAKETSEIYPDVSISSIDDGFRNIEASMDNVPTVDVISSEEDLAAVDAAKADEDAAKLAETAVKTEASEEGKLPNFDQHPDWQRIIKERDEARIEAAVTKAKLEMLSSEAEEKVQPEIPAYKDIIGMSKEELIEWQEDDPHGYAANLYAQIRDELRAELKTAQDKDSSEKEQAKLSATIKTTFENYENKNPDFRTKWDSGELQKFMNENPGHNAISAHMHITEKTRMETAVAKAVKEAEERVIKNFQAKKNAEVISDIGAIKMIDQIADELKNPQKYGGDNAALALRLTRMRQAAV